MSRLVVPAAVILALTIAGCGDDEADPTTTGDTGTGDTGTGDTGTDGGGSPPVGPEWFPGGGEPDAWLRVDGLDGPVRVIYDDMGIPHIYGETEKDMAFAQGYVTAEQRIFQMHTLRMASSGRLAEMLGAGSLRGDVLLRMLGLRRTAEAMAENAKKDHPHLYALLLAFADGTNRRMQGLKSGEFDSPIEIAIFGAGIEPWTPVDTMVIVRLQTYQLGFGGYVAADAIHDIATAFETAFAGTELEGVEVDILNLAPPNTVPTIEGWGAGKPGAKATRMDLRRAMQTHTQKRITPALRKALRDGRKEMDSLPHNLFRGPDYGSNNWVVSGEHTATGKPLVNNDPHLSLRNPAIFYQVHLSDKPAGGDFELSGVNFAGAPGIVLGTNGHIAWGATVFFSDVTDVYVEDLIDDGAAVMFEGKAVPLESKEEVFDFTHEPYPSCDEAVGSWLSNLDPRVESLGGSYCRVTLTVKSVPHHGPLIPWSIGEDADGKPIAMSWRWTGFEPTDEMVAVDAVSRARNWEEFKAALDQFGVGAQNWIYGDTAGNIGWYPSHLLPIRKHVAQCQKTPDCVVLHPPFLPLPGDGSAEWDGFVPRDQLPRAYNPPEGFLVTANADPTGTSFDNDVFNDGHHYLGYLWAGGFRMRQAHERVAAAVVKGKVTKEDMMAIQADEHSNFGARLRGPLEEAIKAAEAGADVGAAALLTPEVSNFLTALEAWDERAPSGVDEGDAESAGVTSAMNVMVTYLVEDALGDEAHAAFGKGGLGELSDAWLSRVLLRMLEAPEGMVTWDPVSRQSRLWDHLATVGTVETRDEILVGALAKALDWLDERFASKTVTDWVWGDLHTLRLHHNVVASYDIPPAEEFENGFPRHGDMFSLDASHPGMRGRNFEYGHGPAIRHVMSMVTPVERYGVVPGGQNEDPRLPHYRDQIDLWVENEAPMVPMTVQDVLAAKERVFDLHPND